MAATERNSSRVQDGSLYVFAERLTAEAHRNWQPQVHARARKRTAGTDGVVIETRERFGSTAASGTADGAYAIGSPAPAPNYVTPISTAEGYRVCEQ